MKRTRLHPAIVLAAAFLALAGPARAEVTLAETKETTFSVSPEIMTDVVMLDNNIDLDSKIRDDRVQYLGFVYSCGFGITSKSEGGPALFAKVKRYGPYDYDVPAVINNTLQTFVTKMDPYQNAEYLPELAEFWADVPIPSWPVRLKGGLFTYTVGHKIALGGAYENYGLMLSSDAREECLMRCYFAWPDLSNKPIGPMIHQEKEQGINWERPKAWFWATDVTITAGNHTVQPYIGALIDRSDGKRINYFSTPTRDEVLGTVGVSWDATYFEELSVSLEWARNFGVARSNDPLFDGVVHQGYMFYADASYDFTQIVPHSRFLFTSGNKLTDDMITNGDTTYTGTKNNAFSIYSPLNAALADTCYHDIDTLPLVAMGNGWGNNYGIRRPDTFSDPIMLDNLILVNAGFDLPLTKKASVTVDWWYLSSVEKGIGMYNNVPKVISPDLGNEFDLYYTYAVTKNITFTCYSGIFLPGAAYREERDDTGGSLFTPYVRGDGKADPAYQAEFSLTVSY